ncbi:hypothetical protein AVEN_39591-1 [Araneus ventricosus]|uniref:Uncharacterized protein n=1 Tax=Araneus ventricosus TaxID=182803 RepID=A0A4Y2HLC5_ARAVE|nr:hypothetical protein AVEN_39591-1 [Araneus ventricosus]
MSLQPNVHNASSIIPSIIVLGKMPSPSGRKYSIEGIRWSLKKLTQSGDFNLLLHSVAEPSPAQHKHPQIIALPPQACTAGVLLF